MALDRKIFITFVLVAGIVLLSLAFSASPAWAQATGLTVNKTGEPRTVVQGENVTYTITVTNNRV
ncbi:MAG: DUF11 domain-containing protein [Actinomycetota bacterium]|nr:DUF11 domain-containing protein [Actinomycetota bacterium]